MGNVGQLSADLLLSSLDLVKICGLDHPGIIPMVGADPIREDSQDLMTACERKDLNILVIIPPWWLILKSNFILSISGVESSEF